MVGSPAWAQSACLTLDGDEAAEDWQIALALASRKAGLELDWQVAESCPAEGPWVRVTAERVAVSDGERVEEHALDGLPVEARPRLGARAFADLAAGPDDTLLPLVSLDGPAPVLEQRRSRLAPWLRVMGSFSVEPGADGEWGNGAGSVALGLRLGGLPLTVSAAVSVGGWTAGLEESEECEEAYYEVLADCELRDTAFCEELADTTRERCREEYQDAAVSGTSVEAVAMVRAILGKGRWTVRPGVGVGWRGLYGLEAAYSSAAFALECDVGWSIAERMTLVGGLRTRFYATPATRLRERLDPLEIYVGGQLGLEWML